MLAKNRIVSHEKWLVSRQSFFVLPALLFLVSAAVTVVRCASMSTMDAGGWTMAPVWMPMCGQTWLDNAISFLSMWVVMMVAMMLPSLMPMLSRYRQAVGEAGDQRLDRLTAVVGLGYFFVWTALGIAIFALGAALAAAEMQLSALARAVPILAGVVAVGAGLFLIVRAVWLG